MEQHKQVPVKCAGLGEDRKKEKSIRHACIYRHPKCAHRLTALSPTLTFPVGHTTAVSPLRPARMPPWGQLGLRLHQHWSLWIHQSFMSSKQLNAVWPRRIEPPGAAVCGFKDELVGRLCAFKAVRLFKSHDTAVSLGLSSRSEKFWTVTKREKFIKGHREALTVMQWLKISP